MKHHFPRFIDKFRAFDVFTKPLDDFQERTLYGGIVTILCWMTIAYLVVLEFADFLQTSWKEELFVDTSGEAKLPINIDIIIPAISCDYVSLDATDSSGDQHINIDYNIYKKRLDKQGNPINDAPKKEELKPFSIKNVSMSQENELSTEMGLSQENELSLSNETGVAAQCGSCYGAETEFRKCCNTCAEVKEAYRRKRWDLDTSKVVQCKNRKETNASAFDEGCNIYGAMEVSRVGGSFHVAPGQSFSISHLHIHDIHPYSASSFNTTHIIRGLSFGKKLSLNNGIYTSPLDGHVGYADQGSTMFQYYIKLIPTLIEKDGISYYTNQYSVTKFQKRVSVSSGDSGMPGIFFSYELSALMVKKTADHKSIGHLVTKILGIVSGVYVAALIIDSTVHRFYKAWEKTQLGKMS